MSKHLCSAYRTGYSAGA